MTRKEIIDGLKMTMGLITFDPSTGEDIDPDDLNDLNRTTYDACKCAVELLESQDVTLHMNLPEVSVEEAIEILKRNNRIELLPPAQPERKKPVFKTGESVYHVSYADGTGGFEKNKWADWTCPDCGWFVGEQYIPRRHNQQKCNYCAKCGCAIDWSDADMRGEQDE